MRVTLTLAALLLSASVACAAPAVIAAYTINGKTPGELGNMTADQIRAAAKADWSWTTELTPGVTAKNQFIIKALKVHLAITPKVAPHRALLLGVELREEYAGNPEVTGPRPANAQGILQIFVREGESVILGRSLWTSTLSGGTTETTAHFYVVTLGSP